MTLDEAIDAIDGSDRVWCHHNLPWHDILDAMHDARRRLLAYERGGPGAHTHTFTWMTTGFNGETEPPPHALCLCGLRYEQIVKVAP